MKSKLNRFQARLVCAVVLGLGSSFSLAAAAEDSVDTAPAKTSIPSSQVGTKARADHQGDWLVVIPTADGARLRCVFQRLEGEAKSEGLWLTSTIEGRQTGRFRVMATAVGRLADVAQPSRLRVNGASSPRSASGDETSPELAGEDACATSEVALPRTGTVELADKLTRFVRPGLTEEYTVSMDGLRQDFIIEQRPVGAGPLRVELVVAGAKVEPLADGAQLVLENSGRKIAYRRLRVTDATGKELTARMEVVDDGESQRDFGGQPRVASLRATLGQMHEQITTLKGLRRAAQRRHHERNDATPLGLRAILRGVPRVARRTRNPGLTDAIPLGLFASTNKRQTKTRA